VAKFSDSDRKTMDYNSVSRIKLCVNAGKRHSFTGIQVINKVRVVEFKDNKLPLPSSKSEICSSKN